MYPKKVNSFGLPMDSPSPQSSPMPPPQSSAPTELHSAYQGPSPSVEQNATYAHNSYRSHPNMRRMPSGGSADGQMLPHPQHPSPGQQHLEPGQQHPGLGQQYLSPGEQLPGPGQQHLIPLHGGPPLSRPHPMVGMPPQPGMSPQQRMLAQQGLPPQGYSGLPPQQGTPAHGHPGMFLQQGPPPQGHFGLQLQQDRPPQGHPGMPLQQGLSPQRHPGMHPNQQEPHISWPYPSHSQQKQNAAFPGPQGGAPQGPPVQPQRPQAGPTIDNNAAAARGGGNGIMNQLQLNQLRNQIEAYCYIARKQSIPPQIIRALPDKRPDGSPQFPTPPSNPFQVGSQNALPPAEPFSAQPQRPPTAPIKDNLNALQSATMEKMGMRDDQRYSQDFALRARSYAAAVSGGENKILQGTPPQGHPSMPPQQGPPPQGYCGMQPQQGRPLQGHVGMPPQQDPFPQVHPGMHPSQQQPHLSWSYPVHSQQRQNTATYGPLQFPTPHPGIPLQQGLSSQGHPGMHPNQQQPHISWPYPNHLHQRENTSLSGPQGSPGQPQRPPVDALRSRSYAAAARGGESGIINQLQMNQLRNQIEAYSCIAQNLPIPPQVILALHGKRPDGSLQFPTPPSNPFQVGSQNAPPPAEPQQAPQGFKPGLPNSANAPQ